jgi:hypothetical protein
MSLRDRSAATIGFARASDRDFGPVATDLSPQGKDGSHQRLSSSAGGIVTAGDHAMPPTTVKSAAQAPVVSQAIAVTMEPQTFLSART